MLYPLVVLCDASLLHKEAKISISKLTRPEIQLQHFRASLPLRKTPYYQLVVYGRHIGYLRDESGDAWYARIRTRAESYYRRRLGLAATEGNPDGLSYEQALTLAHEWFSSSGIKPWAAEPKRIGVSQELVVCPVPGPYAVAHAISDYVEWKRLAAAKSHFETNLSSINFHIIPRLGNILLSEFTGEHLRRFVRDVLETPPKRGNRPVEERRSMDRMDDEQLRKRKKP